MKFSDVDFCCNPFEGAGDLIGVVSPRCIVVFKDKNLPSGKPFV
jgi:hypothetical protein